MERNIEQISEGNDGKEIGRGSLLTYLWYSDDVTSSDYITLNDRIINNGFGRLYMRKWSWHNFWYCTEIYLEGLGNNKRTFSHDGLCSGQSS